MNTYVKNSIFASEYLLLPIMPNPLSTEGFQTLLKEINYLFEENHLTTKVLGVFFTIVEENLTVSQFFKDELNKDYNDLLFETQIRKDVRLTEAPGLRINVFDYKEKCRGAQDYKNLVYEMLRKV
jgi:chromosome partitioning protein